MNKIFSNKGFTLVEVMITAAILGGLGLVMMNLTKQSAKSSSKLQFDTDATLTTNEVNAMLSDPVKCLATFGVTGTPTNIDSKYYIKSDPSAPTNGYSNSSLKISSYTLSGFEPDGVLTILYENKKILQGTSGLSNVSKTIKIYFEGTIGAVTKCRSLSTSSTDIWSRGSGSTINYSGGNVGVGTVTPGAALDVNGEIKIGSSGVVCDPAHEGQQRYNSTIKNMEFCNGTIWKAIGSTTGVLSTAVYQDQLNNTLTLIPTPMYGATSLSCSNCGSNCDPCPAGTLLSNSCSMAGNCGFRRWRNCTASCRVITGTTAPVGYITKQPPL
jgi:prepilin-type N-terminal cleavage/methylation domain-containing protein